ncbi:S-adenosyl-L-methionine-dependent methyltransferase [Boletus coccyginus]|nr:S-adenosyl-L-methionine-dependent methyltransferase [Boletus coccyginus]
MPSPASTFATLRALQLVIADALDDIQRVFSQHIDSPSSPPSQCSSPVHPSSPDFSPATSPFPVTPPTSFPPTPLSATFPSSLRSPPYTGVPFVDYPSPDLPLAPDSPSEQLALHPDAAAAASRIVAACGQMSNIVHKPFSSLCDAIMSYNLPACMRLVEHLHVVEILREAEEDRQRGLANGQEAAVPLPMHALRLLSTHHIFRETAPDTFALTRVASLLDSGKSVEAVFSNPETKYDENGGTPAFVATDELFKSAAYLTEAFTGRLRSGNTAKPEKLPAFNLALRTNAPFFDWLENGGEDPLGGTGQGACSFRLGRFSRAMIGTTLWEAPKAILRFDWYSLPKGSTIVDVGGGIGSTTMILARALNNDANLRFVVQDRPVVTALGIEAWRSKCPEMLESGQVVFQDQDFFEPQSPFGQPHLTGHPAVYLLRVVLHDWPDECARRILINLRVASNPETRLVIAEHVLPLACIDEDVLDDVHADVCERRNTEEWTLNSVLANVEGAERTLVPPPLVSNLGKASATAYWMDLIMHITFNGKERTLREFCALALSAGWRVTRMTRPEGTLFAYLVCEPVTLPDDAQAIYNAVVLSSELSAVVAVPSDEPSASPLCGSFSSQADCRHDQCRYYPPPSLSVRHHVVARRPSDPAYCCRKTKSFQV